MKTVILKNHPHRALLEREDILADGAIAVIQALREFDPTKWDKSLGAFLGIRVKQRLLDGHRDNRRARETGRITREALEGQPDDLTPSEIVDAVEASGLWRPWLGEVTAQKLATHNATVLAAWERGHLRLDAVDELGCPMGANLPAYSHRDDSPTAEGALLTAHLVGLDRELLLTVHPRAALQREMRHQIIVAGSQLLPEEITAEVVRFASTAALKWAKARVALEEGIGWGIRHDGVEKVIRACEKCGIIWPLKPTKDCRRAECLYGHGEVPALFTYEYWAPYRALAIASLSPNGAHPKQSRAERERAQTPEQRAAINIRRNARRAALTEEQREAGKLAVRLAQKAREANQTPEEREANNAKQRARRAAQRERYANRTPEQIVAKAETSRQWQADRKAEQAEQAEAS